jgi:endoglucanase
MHASRRAGAVLVVALGCAAACSAGAPVTGFEDDAGASSDLDSGALWAGTPRDAAPFNADVSTPPPPPPYDSGPPQPVDAGPPVPCATPLIDDMEHSDGSILSVCGRQGYWYTYNDATSGGSQTPLAATPFTPAIIQGGRVLGDGGASAHAAHTNGNGFTTWGAGMAFDLNSPGAGTKLPYDATRYTGIRFWARIASGTQATVRVNIPERATDAVGNICAPKCSDHFGKTLTLTASWVEYTLHFTGAELAQSGWGTAATFDKSTLLGVQFQVAAGSTFDLWIDDISFVE